MPKDTFLNLPEEKRRLIEDVAVDEFAEYGYEASSINRIVAAAGIAKGSFYQYFADKSDLFMHIITVMGERKLAYISPALMNPADHDFFTLLAEMYRSGLAFAKDDPQASKIAFEVYKNQTNPVFVDVFRESRQLGHAFFVPLIDTAIERGEVSPDIDRRFIIHMLMQLQLASLDYYLENNQHAAWDDDIMPTIHLMIDFIKRGIQHP